MYRATTHNRINTNISSNPQIKTLLYVFAFLFLLLEIRLFSIQVLSHNKYQKMAEAQHWNSQIIPSARGNIYTSDGYVLAGTQYNYLMYGEPNRIVDKAAISHKLADVISTLKSNSSNSYAMSINMPQSKMSSSSNSDGSLEFSDYSERIKDTEDSIKDIGSKTKEELFSYYYDKYYKLLDKNLMWIGLEKGLTPLEKEVIEKEKIYGIGFEEDPTRYYPEGSLSSHILGFIASTESGEKTGYFGVEGKFNEDLKGRPGKVSQEIDALGNPILAGNYQKNDPISGRDLVLTINRTVQYLVEKKLKEGVENYGAVSGTVIVMNPSTGEVIAMANYPTYTPSDFKVPDNEFEPNADYRKSVEKRNLAISQTYEPGSVMKPLTVAVGIDLGLMTPETTFEDNGPVWYYEYQIDNWNGQHHGTQNLIQLLQKSNNIGASWVGHQVGEKNLYEYFKNFGIGSITGIDLEGEDTGLLSNYKDWTDIGLANISFGQGISTTPLQMLNGFNALVNGGYLIEPKIISKVVDKEKDETVDIPTKIIRRVIKEETSKTLVKMLEEAASGGEASYFVSKQYKIAGKTGTAQIPVAGKYDPNKTNATFLGYLSGSESLSMIVKLEEPRPKIYAAETAVPLWMDIANELVKYYGIVPDKEN